MPSAPPASAYNFPAEGPQKIDSCVKAKINKVYNNYLTWTLVAAGILLAATNPLSAVIWPIHTYVIPAAISTIGAIGSFLLAALSAWASRQNPGFDFELIEKPEFQIEGVPNQDANVLKDQKRLALRQAATDYLRELHDDHERSCQTANENLRLCKDKGAKNLACAQQKTTSIDVWIKESEGLINLPNKEENGQPHQRLTELYNNIKQAQSSRKTHEKKFNFEMREAKSIQDSLDKAENKLRKTCLKVTAALTRALKAYQ